MNTFYQFQRKAQDNKIIWGRDVPNPLQGCVQQELYLVVFKILNILQLFFLNPTPPWKYLELEAAPPFSHAPKAVLGTTDHHRNRTFQPQASHHTECLLQKIPRNKS